MSRKVFEKAPVSASLHLTINEKQEDDATKAKSHGKSQNTFKELQQQSTSDNLQPSVIGVRERTSSFNAQHRASTTSTGSSADMVAQAVAAKKRLSEMESSDSEAGGNLSHGDTAGSAILAKLRNEKRASKERTEGNKNGNEDKVVLVEVKNDDQSITEKKSSKEEKESDKVELKVDGMTKEKEGKQENLGITKLNSASRLGRRNKTVEKPVKSLQIASESEPVSPSLDDHTLQLPMVQCTHHATVHTLRNENKTHTHFSQNMPYIKNISRIVGYSFSHGNEGYCTVPDCYQCLIMHGYTHVFKCVL